MNKQSQWLFEAPFPSEATYYSNPYPNPEYNSSSELELALLEIDHMARQPRGRGRGGVDLVRMYHYSPVIIRDAVKRFSRWTDMSFRNRSVQDVARMTSLQVDKIKYRYELILPRKDRDRDFRNVATKLIPGFGAANEYVNQVFIPVNWMQKITPITR